MNTLRSPLPSLIRKLKLCTLLLFAVSSGLSSQPAHAQSATNLAALKGLSPMSVLPNTPEGRAALAANLKVTGGIQTGEISLPTLLPLALQREQALLDAFITGSNISQLADGLGSTLGAGYLARAHYIDEKRSTDLSQGFAQIIRYTERTSGQDSTAGKYFFANGTINGKASVSQAALAILSQTNGQTDVFGKTYGFPAGTKGAGTYGNARPFQTEPNVTEFSGPDYLNVFATNTQYNRGPFMNLTNSPSYPSGHTTYGYTGALLLAICVPERYQQMIARGAEYGNDRIYVGAHYAMDVLGGRALALYDMAHLLANDPAYLGGVAKGAPSMTNFRGALLAARSEMRKQLEAVCGNPIDACAREDNGRFNHAVANSAFYESTQTYGLPVVYPKVANSVEDISKLAPEAGYLLTVAFPELSLQEANQILTETEGPGGGFLDNGSSFGVYSRIDLYAAAGKASQVSEGRRRGANTPVR